MLFLFTKTFCTRRSLKKHFVQGDLADSDLSSQIEDDRLPEMIDNLGLQHESKLSVVKGRNRRDVQRLQMMIDNLGLRRESKRSVGKGRNDIIVKMLEVIESLGFFCAKESDQLVMDELTGWSVVGQKIVKTPDVSGNQGLRRKSTVGNEKII